MCMVTKLSWHCFFNWTKLVLSRSKFNGFQGFPLLSIKVLMLRKPCSIHHRVQSFLTEIPHLCHSGSSWWGSPAFAIGWRVSSLLSQGFYMLMKPCILHGAAGFLHFPLRSYTSIKPCIRHRVQSFLTLIRQVLQVEALHPPLWCRVSSVFKLRF